MGTREERMLIAKVIDTFPVTFGLRGFPGDLFKISESASYFGGAKNETLMLYTARWDGKNWNDFAKGTEYELRREIVVRPPVGLTENGREDRSTPEDGR